MSLIEIKGFRNSFGIADIKYHPTGEFFASTDCGGQVRLWDIRHKNAVNSYMGSKEQEFHSIKFTPDGSWLIGIAKAPAPFAAVVIHLLYYFVTHIISDMGFNGRESYSFISKHQRIFFKYRLQSRGFNYGFHQPVRVDYLGHGDIFTSLHSALA